MAGRNRKTRRAIASVRKKYVEALDLRSEEDPAVVFDGLDSEEYSFTHPLFMDDETAAIVNNPDGSSEEKVRAILGDDQYERFMSHPAHRPSDVMLLLGDVGRETQDVMGDGTPTQPSIS